MKVAIRVDASPEIGYGHLMRCLTLADLLKSRGAYIRFIVRHLPKNLHSILTARGHEFALFNSSTTDASVDELSHAHWLGVSQAQDAADSIQGLSGQLWDWLIVDHYALDSRWESALRRTARRIFVIDDIADRQHDCNLLLDQNLYVGMDHRYDGLVPDFCIRLLGPRFAMLRPEFKQTRATLRERDGNIGRIIVFFGGSDPTNETIKTLESMRLLSKPDICVDIVVGLANANLKTIEELCRNLPSCNYHCHISNMAELMAHADLMICSGGSITWERCCLALPGLVISVSHNQELLAQNSASAGSAIYLGTHSEVSAEQITWNICSLMENRDVLREMSLKGMKLVDGEGCGRVLMELEKFK
jgi:UDP-2,4-diacetamido-2,4,6-trideoxy-beta-L-altropyranose hydrolase